MRNPTPIRLLRRGGIWILMWAVIAGMGLEWLHHKITELTHPILRWMRLHRVIPWLREHSIWWLLPIGLVFVPIIAVAKIVEIWLLVNYFPIGVLAFVVFKVAAVGIGNVFVEAYAERLLRYERIARWYAAYTRIRDELKLWMRRQEWYARAVRMRDAYGEWKRNTITMLDFSRRAAGMHQCCMF